MQFKARAEPKDVANHIKYLKQTYPMSRKENPGVAWTDVTRTLLLVTLSVKYDNASSLQKEGKFKEEINKYLRSRL